MLLRQAQYIVFATLRWIIFTAETLSSLSFFFFAFFATLRWIVFYRGGAEFAEFFMFVYFFLCVLCDFAVDFFYRGDAEFAEFFFVFSVSLWLTHHGGTEFTEFFFLCVLCDFAVDCFLPRRR